MVCSAFFCNMIAYNVYYRKYITKRRRVMKRTLVVFVALLALFLTTDKVDAQIRTSGLDTLIEINGYRLVEYAPGVTRAVTWFTNVNPFHGRFSQFFEVDRLSPSYAGEREYTATFKKMLLKRIKRGEALQIALNYVQTGPVVVGHTQIPVLDIAFENKGIKSIFKNLVFNERGTDTWGLRTLIQTEGTLDSVDCIYLRISGDFKETAIQVDYLAFTDFNLNILDVIDDFEDSTITDIKDEFAIPTSYSLSQNYPNPFNPSTTITFQLSKSNFVSLKVFDVLGREIETLVNEEKPIGEHSVHFDGSPLSSGMYIYQINIGHGQFVQTKKMILMK